MGAILPSEPFAISLGGVVLRVLDRRSHVLLRDFTRRVGVAIPFLVLSALVLQFFCKPPQGVAPDGLPAPPSMVEKR